MRNIGFPPHFMGRATLRWVFVVVFGALGLSPIRVFCMVSLHCF
jgi:hypothetical protein